MVICDGCNQGFHLACFGMSHVPETETWHCPGCSTLQQLQVGSTVVIEATQLLYKGSTEPHHTQGLFLATISSLGPMQQDGSGSYREVYVRSNRAPLQASVRYYSKTLPYKALQRVPLQSQQLATQLMQQPGLRNSTSSCPAPIMACLGQLQHLWASAMRAGWLALTALPMLCASWLGLHGRPTFATAAAAAAASQQLPEGV
jgi:hypothetical protein